MSHVTYVTYERLRRYVTYEGVITPSSHTTTHVTNVCMSHVTYVTHEQIIRFRIIDCTLRVANVTYERLVLS